MGIVVSAVATCCSDFVSHCTLYVFYSLSIRDTQFD